jgi:hypothetical protein
MEMLFVLKFLAFLLISPALVSLITQNIALFHIPLNFFFLKVSSRDSDLNNEENDFYTAAVAEFAVLHESNSARGNIEEALTDYLRLINEASESGADVVVFPEGSLNYNGLNTRESLLNNAVVVRDSEIYNSTSVDNVCDYSRKTSKVCRSNLILFPTKSSRQTQFSFQDFYPFTSLPLLDR